jgi:hypothetical protein
LSAALLLSAVLLPSAAEAQSSAYDGFNSGPAADLAGSSAGSGWTSAWSPASSDVTQIGGAGLQYPGLVTRAGGAITPPAGGVWPSSIYQRAFALPTGSSSYYVSFLLRDDAGVGSWAGLSFGAYPYKVTVGSPLGYYTFGLQTSEGLGSVSNQPLVTGLTTLVVVKISKNAGAGIHYRLYLDPTIGAPEPSFPACSLNLPPVQSLPSALSIDNGTGFTTDEIRVGSTWASVLPPAPSNWTDLGFAKPGISGAPKLVGSGALVAGNSVTLALTNARPGSSAWLVIGDQVLNLPFLGGILVPEADALVSQVTDGSGAASLSHVWPSGFPAGTTLAFQTWILDPAASGSVSASNGLSSISQ